MNSVGNNYQNCSYSNGYKPIFIANPAMAIKPESVFHKAPSPKGTTPGDIFGYGLLTLLTGAVAIKGDSKALSKIKKFLSKNKLIKDLKLFEEKHNILNRIKEQSSNISTLFQTWKHKILSKVHLYKKINTPEN